MPSKRTHSLSAALLTGVFAVTGAAILAPQSAEAAVGECPTTWGTIGPGIGGDFFDQNVNVFAGGNFTVTGEAAEAEGVVVALGDASFNKTSPGLYNVGVVGVGSGVSPNPGTDMLIVGGDLSANANTTIDVGSGIGGNVVVGGTIAPGTNIVTNGGTTSPGVAGATTPYDGMPALIQSKSTEIAAFAPTGTVALTGFSATFTGDGTSNRQVFNVAASDLGTASRSLQFLGIPAGAAIYINVTGGPATLNFNALLTEAGTVMNPNADPAFPEIATHTMWNFPTADVVNISGFAQLPGSILVPSPTSDTVNSAPGTNGRVWVNGNLTHTGTGSEMHSYAFLPDEDLDCEALAAALGGFTVDKVLSDPDGVVDPALQFAGTFACTLNGNDVTPADNSWTTTAAAAPTVVTDQLEVGTVCTLTETPPADTATYTWQPATITPTTVTIASPDTSAGFTVTNTASAVPVDPTDPTDPVDPTDPTDPTDSPSGPSPTTDPTEPGAQENPGNLPNTGSPVGLWVVGALGIAMLLAGALLIPATRGQRAAR